MSLLNALTIIFKHKKAILWIFLATVTVVTGYTFLQKRTFEAEASLLVKMFQENTSRPGMGTDNNNLPRIASQDEVINAEIQILTGRELVEKVIKALHLEIMYPDLAGGSASETDLMERAVETFRTNLQVVGVRKSNVVTVSFQHNDPEIAAKAVNLLVEAFKEKHLALHADPQSSFIGNQLASFENQLKDSEKNLQEYQQKNKAFSLEEQRSLLLRQRTEFDSAYKMASSNVSENQKRINSIKSQMKYIASNRDRYTQTERDNIIIEAKSKALELQLKEQELRRKYTDNNRLVIDVRKEVETVNEFLRDQEEMIRNKVKTGNPVYQSMETDLFRAEAELRSQEAKANAIAVQLRLLDQEIADLDKSESRIQDLKRRIAINEKNYMTYVDRHENARIADVMNRLKLSNISVIQAAVAPAKPIKPNRKLNILLGIVFSAASGLIYAFLMENIAQTFLDPESVETFLELPVLLTVPSKGD